MVAKNSTIEIYRANIANPQDLSATLFWLKNELVSIQRSSFSTEDVIRKLQEAIATIEAGGAKGDKGDKGQAGSKGAPGESIKGDKGEPGASGASDIEDNIVALDSVWSSRKIFDELAGVAPASDAMTWYDQFYNSTVIHPKSTMVSANGWIAISNTITGAYPFPQPLGNPLPLYPTTPVWDAVNSHTGQVRSGYYIRVNEPGELRSAQVWCPAVSANITYTLVIVKDPPRAALVTAGPAVDKGDGTVGVPCTAHPFAVGDNLSFSGTVAYLGGYNVGSGTTANEIVFAATFVAETFTGAEIVSSSGSNVVRREPIGNDLLTAAQWSSIPLNNIFAAVGDGFLIYLEAHNFSSTTSVPGEYLFDGREETDGPPVGSFNRNTNQTILRINDTDNLAATPALNTLVGGSTILLQKSGATDNYLQYLVIAAVDKTDYFEFEVQITGSGGTLQSTDVCVLAGSIPVSLATEYISEASKWATPPAWGNFNAYLEHGGVDQSPAADLGFGINFAFQQQVQSPDWDLIALGGGASSSVSSSGLAAVVDDPAPELGGDLDGGRKEITNVRLLQISGDATTYTSEPAAFVGVTGNHSYDYSTGFLSLGVVFPPAVIFNGVQTLERQANPYGMGTLFQAAATFKNEPSTVANLAGFYTFASVNTFQADTQTIALPLTVDSIVGPAFETINSGVLTVGTLIGISNQATAGAGVTISARLGFSCADVVLAGGATLTSQAGFVTGAFTSPTNYSHVLTGTATVPSGKHNTYQANEDRNQWNGAQQYKLRSGAVWRTLDYTDHFLEWTGGATGIYSLPLANTCKGREYVIKSTGAGAIILVPGTGDTFDGVAGNHTITGGSKLFERWLSDGGTNWIQVG
tara:strand:- start:3609 stop:6203 length:2595 start_codon:yes stop_codon:yes gene_type:complete